jgi:dUTP pyrophosphatase
MPIGLGRLLHRQHPRVLANFLESRLVVDIPIQRLDPDLPLPVRQHASDAGYDLVAREDVVLGPGERALVPTGIAVAIPEGYAGFVQPRSGLAIKHGISIVNTPGLIDSGYRGELKVVLVNLDVREKFTVKRGARIAQLVVQRVADVTWHEVVTLDDTDRGAGGHGSTGV